MKSASEPAGTDLALDWALERQGDHLRLEYTLRNRTKEPILALDELVVGGDRAPDRVIVRNGDEPELVVLSLGLVRTPTKVGGIPLPIGRIVGPGEAIRGTRSIPLPLRTWHNYSSVPPLDPGRDRAVLEIGVLDDVDALEGVKLAGGETVESPRPAALGAQRFVRGAALELP